MTITRRAVGPWLATLAQHLEGARGGPEVPTRRFGVVRHIADLFDGYGVHRPDMVRDWVAGADRLGLENAAVE